MNFQNNKIEDSEGLCRRVTTDFYDGVRLNPSLFEDTYNDLSVDSRSNRNDNDIFNKQIEVYFKTRRKDPSTYPKYLGFAETQYCVYKANNFLGKRTPTENESYKNEFHCILKYNELENECEFKKAIIAIRDASSIHLK